MSTQSSLYCRAVHNWLQWAPAPALRNSSVRAWLPWPAMGEHAQSAHRVPFSKLWGPKRKVCGTTNGSLHWLRAKKIAGSSQVEGKIQSACMQKSKLMVHGWRLLVVGVNSFSTLAETTTRHHKTRTHQRRVHCSQTGRWHPVRLSANRLIGLCQSVQPLQILLNSTWPHPSATSDLGLPIVIHCACLAWKRSQCCSSVS